MSTHFFIHFSVTFRGFQCSTYDLTLSCAQNQAIFVISAAYGLYGYNSTQDDITCKPPQYRLDCTESMESNFPTDWLVLKERCDGQTTCTFTAQYGVMSTCGEGLSADYTDVEYQCLPGKIKISFIILYFCVVAVQICDLHDYSMFWKVRAVGRQWRFR